MGLLIQEVEIDISSNTIKTYEKLGYTIPKLKVNVLDLPENSKEIVKIKCDLCGKEVEITYYNYNRKIKRSGGLYSCGCKNIYAPEVNLDEFKQDLLNFQDLNNKKPACKDVKLINGFKYSNTLYAKKIKETLGISIGEYFNQIFNTGYFAYDKSKYYDYLNILISNIDTIKNTTRSIRKLCNDNNLPSLTWFITNCPNKDVVTFNDFIEWCGYIGKRCVSKEGIIKTIYHMQDQLDRPLMYEDFTKSDENNIGISSITRIWGSLNKMKEDLGIEIVQENMICKSITLEEAKQDIIKLCDDIFLRENRKVIGIKDFDTNSSYLNYSTYKRYFKNNDSDIIEFIETLGYEFNKAGCGMRYDYEDGEKTYSKYEFDFSNYLRENGLIYNKDYFRDIKYDNFVDDCLNNMNCDYEIHIDDKVIYVEIAGFLNRYTDCFIGDIEITNSFRKEKYRLKLKEKEKMFKENNLHYYILFPSEDNRDILVNDEQLNEYIENKKPEVA